MTEKELKKLNRAELLEMLIAQSKKLARTEEELTAAQRELERREIAISASGTLAEAALKLCRSGGEAVPGKPSGARDSGGGYYCRGAGQSG